MKYKAILFDLDGTLLDTLGDLSAAVNYALAFFSLPLLSDEAVRQRIGNGEKTLISRCVPPGTPMETETRVLEIFREYYRQNTDLTTRPYPGVDRLLAALSEKKIPMAVVTNKDEISAQKLVERFFPGVFGAVCGTGTGTEVRGQRSEARGREILDLTSIPYKPDPALPLKALGALDVSASDALLIGDSVTDLQTAENCGCGFLCVGWGYGGYKALEEQGVGVVCDVDEIIKRSII